MTKEAVNEKLALITPPRLQPLAGCDLVIEAVFEDRKIKAEVTKRAEAAACRNW
jgi:3-hydroxyacyl-CoA dehydrogenase/enoyl-CoA hydratase/3-hydroxybutyryl-CoA epimerase